MQARMISNLPQGIHEGLFGHGKGVLISRVHQAAAESDQNTLVVEAHLVGKNDYGAWINALPADRQTDIDV